MLDFIDDSFNLYIYLYYNIQTLYTPITTAWSLSYGSNVSYSYGVNPSSFYINYYYTFNLYTSC